MLTVSEYQAQDALGLAALVRKKEVSAGELLDLAMCIAEQVQPDINCFVDLFADRARAEIRAGLPAGPFTGVPFALKDLFSLYAGRRTGNGSALFNDFVPQLSSELFARYVRAGFAIFAKTSTPEFGLSATTEPRTSGATRNPHDLSRSAGGSSGGAAAAVAAGVIPLAHASDSGGSIRIPASTCGLFGLKPSRGRMPMGPDRGESSAGLGTAHAVGISVRDSAALLDATAGPDAGAPYGIAPSEGTWLNAALLDPAPLRIGLVLAHPNGQPVDPECEQACLATARLCEELGHHVDACTLPVDLAALRRASAPVLASTTRALIDARAKTLGRAPIEADVEPVTWAIYQMAAGVTGAQFVAAQGELHRAGRLMATLHERFDVILMPTLAELPAEIGHLSMNTHNIDEYFDRVARYSPFTSLANITGAPAMTLPLFTSASGLPVGTQVVGRFGDEATLLGLAGQIERAQPWGRRSAMSVSSHGMPRAEAAG